ncbi:5-oxoprolinase subunit PxpB [Acidothermaceae bacterium B102]|nr:5-oxoprolinase subunit PxpB [Acidothermaceae bacterium B102]
MTLRCLPMGETALLVACGDLATVRRVDAALRSAELPWVRETVPAYDTVLVVGLPGCGEELDALAAALPSWDLPNVGSVGGREVVIEVAYDGPDLADVCRLTGLTLDDLVALHTAPAYTVAFLGFSPGFPYLVGLDPRLAVPRLDTPRVSVPPGSVGIGGDQTGVYPTGTPGGWRLIGRTDAVLFDAARDPATLLVAGDAVRFAAR